VKNFSQGRKWNNVFANIHKQSLPLQYGRRDVASTASTTKVAFRLVLPEELNGATTSHLSGASSKAEYLNLYQESGNVSTCSTIMLKNDDTPKEYMSYN
jgi:hypothetical protein